MKKITINVQLQIGINCYEYEGQDTERVDRLRWEAAKASPLVPYCLGQGTCLLIGSQPKNNFIN